MKERPIIFSGEMVRAILDGRKTQTRRLVKNQGRLKVVHGWNGRYLQTNMIFEDGRLGITSPYMPGDRLWVREAWLDGLSNRNDAEKRSREDVYYRADGEFEERPFEDYLDSRWLSPIFMPRWASRITLEITGVRLERLQEITEADAQAEGVDKNHFGELTVIPDSMVRGGILLTKSYVAGFGVRWDVINGNKHPWESNPWVWAISFKRIENDEQNEI